MENKVLKKNISHLASYDKKLADKILMTDTTKSNIFLSKTVKEEYNIIFNNNEIHSQKGAVLESEIIAKTIKNNTDSLILVYGLGLGYLPDAISNVCKKSKIIIYEPNIEIIKFVLSIAQIDALYKDDVYLCSDKESFVSLVKKIIKYDMNLSIAFLDSYKLMYKDDIYEIFNLANDIMLERCGNMNTFIEYMPLAATSSFYNLKKIIQSPKVEDLKDVYKNKTALILCAGPSLEENIEDVIKNKDKVVTFALNPTLKLLKKYSITPDFIVNIDTVENAKQFSEIDITNSYYITEAFTNLHTANLPSKNHFFYISDENFFNFWIRKIFNINNNFETLGTSSYVAFSSALYMGFTKIIFIGQDLAFKNGKCYSSGSQYDCLECVFNTSENKYEIVVPDFEKFKNSYRNVYQDDEQAQIGAKKMLDNLNRNIKTVKGAYGNLIPTKNDYYTFIKLFENAAKNLKNIELINSSFGANIAGFKNICLKDALEGEKSIDKMDLTGYSSDYNVQKIAKEIDILLRKLEATLKLLEEFNLIANDLFKEIEAKKVITKNTQKFIEKYKDAFEKLLVSFEDENIGKLLSYCAYGVYKILKTDYFKNADILYDALGKIIPAFKNMENDLNVYIAQLAHSKSFIF